MNEAASRAADAARHQKWRSVHGKPATGCRNLSPITTRIYLRAIEEFAQYSRTDGDSIPPARGKLTSQTRLLMLGDTHSTQLAIRGELVGDQGRTFTSEANLLCSG
jgi:hypothetical protein